MRRCRGDDVMVSESRAEPPVPSPAQQPLVPAGDVDDAPDAVDQAWRRAVAAAGVRGASPGANQRGARKAWKPTRRAGQPDFAGDTATSGAGPGARDPLLLGELTTSLINHEGWQHKITVAGVMGRWAEVVGEQIAQSCRPESFTDGVLVVRATTTAWATQLTYMTGDLARRMADVVGDGVVDRVEVVGPTAPSWRHGRLRTPYARGARDTYG